MSLARNVVDWVKVESRKDAASIMATLASRPFNGYVGFNGYGNLGDEAVYEAAKELFPSIKPFRISKPTQLTASLLRRDLPLKSFYLGGGTLINQSRLWLLHAEYAVAHQVPSFCIGTGVASKAFLQSFGLHPEDDMQRWTKVLENFVYVGVRGPHSQKTLKQAGFKAEIVGDAAFALAAPMYDKRKTHKKPHTIGVNISYGTDNAMWGDADTFIDHMTHAITAMVADGFAVKILPIWHEDLAISEKVAQAVGHKNCQVVRAYQTLDRYLAEVRSCDAFVGLKLHATIFAVMERVPSIMLGYRPKCLDFMASVEQEKFSIRTDKVTKDHVLEKLHALIEDRHAIAATLHEYALHYKALQDQRAREIVSNLKLIT